VASIRRFHAGQRADHRLELEDRLQRPLAHLRLIGRIGGVELAAQQDVVDSGWDEVMICPRAAKDREVARMIVGFSQRLQLRHDFKLTRWIGQVQGGEAVCRRHGVEQVLNGWDANRRQHLLAFGVGMRNVTHENPNAD
jgi:hypothetical protein